MENAVAQRNEIQQISKETRRIAGMFESEVAAGITANDWLAWARQRLGELYMENDRIVQEKLDIGKNPGGLDQRIQILRTLTQNIASAAKAAAELQSIRMQTYKKDPAFQRIWGLMLEIVRQHPEARERLEEALEAEGLNAKAEF